MSDRGRPSRHYRWAPTLPIGRVLGWLLVASGGLSVITALLELRVAMTATSVTDTLQTVSRFSSRGSRSPLVFAASPLGLACGVLWLIWQHKVHADLFARGVPGLRFTPGWAVGWWFVPFASFVQPVRAVRELSRHAGRAGALGPDDRPAVSDGLLAAWWSSYLGYGVLAVGAFAVWIGALWSVLRHGGNATTIVTVHGSTLRAIAGWWVASDLVHAVAAFLAATVVLRISRAEDGDRDLAIDVPPRPDIS